MTGLPVSGADDDRVERVDVMRAWRRTVSAPLDAATLQRTLEQTLECLDALIGGSEPERGDLRVLAEHVARVAPAAEARGLDLTIETRSRSPLVGRDLRRWTWLLQGMLDSLLAELPGGSAVRVGLGCVATTSGHRWLQADITATVAVDPHDTGEPRAPRSGESDIRELLIGAALRLLDGACVRTQTDAGPVLRLVVPVQG
jgi:hypothetical protein